MLMTSDKLLEFLHNAGRKLLAITVAFGISVPSLSRPARGNDIEDFERYVDQAIIEYRNFVLNTAQYERDKIAPTQVRQGLENAISISQLAMQISRDEIVADTTFFNMAVGQLDDIVRSVSIRWQPGAGVDLNGYEQLLHNANDYERRALTASATLSRIRENIIGMKEYIAQYESFCHRNVPRLTLASLSLTPFSTKRKADSLQSNPHRFMDDPVAKSYAITAGVTTFAAGFAIYSAVYGWEAAMALLTVEAGSGGVVTVGSSSPVGWLILGATVVVAYYVGMWKVREENKERERRANGAWSKLLRGIAESQEWFARNRLTESEYRESAMLICHEEETKADGRLKKLAESNQTNLIALHQQLRDLETTSDDLIKNIETFGKAKAKYEEALIAVYGHQIVKEHRERILSEERVSEAMRYFNEQIKPQWQLFADYYSANLGDCVAIGLQARDIIDRIKFYTTIVRSSYKDSRNGTRSEFTEIESMTNGIVDRIDNRVQRCDVGFNLGEIPDDIYPMP